MAISKERREVLENLGIDVIDRTTHPMVIASTWATGGKAQLGEKADYRYLHIYPESALVTPIGNLWKEGGWWRLQDMLFHCANNGHNVSLQEMRDTSPLSTQAIGLMRWQASMTARDAGVEWLLMVDNDVLLEKDTLLRLMAHDRPVVFPLIEDLEQRFPEEVSPLSCPPALESGQGLVPVRWSAMSCMLFNTRIFNVLDSNAWWGTDYHFGQALNYIGHRIYVDTDTVIKVSQGPTRAASLDYDEFWAANRTFNARHRGEERDRRPPPGFNPETDDGWLDKNGCYFAMPNHMAKKFTNEGADDAGD